MAALHVIYDKQAITMFEQQLKRGKGEKAIAPSVALAATSILQQMGPKAQQLPEKEMWGKDGVVQVMLGALFELAKEMGYNAPHAQLKTAYKIVEEQIDKSGFGSGGQQQGQQAGPQGQGPQGPQPPPGPQGGPPGMAPQQPNMMAQAAMGGQPQ